MSSRASWSGSRRRSGFRGGAWQAEGEADAGRGEAAGIGFARMRVGFAEEFGGTFFGVVGVHSVWDTERGGSGLFRFSISSQSFTAPENEEHRSDETKASRTSTRAAGRPAAP